MNKNFFSPSQVIVRTAKKADLIKGESRGIYLGRKQVVSSKEVRQEINRRISMNLKWMFEG